MSDLTCPACQQKTDRVFCWPSVRGFNDSSDQFMCFECSSKQLEAIYQKYKKLNEDIEGMFFFAFASGFNACGEHSIKAVSEKIQGCMSSGLFPDLSREYMKKYFTEHNPPSSGEKEK